MFAKADQTQQERLGDCPPPPTGVSGWYPDPLGSTGERYWDGSWREGVKAARARLERDVVENGAGPARRLGRLRRRPTLTVPPLSRGAREQRARERERERQDLLTEAARQAFLRTPAGRARVAFERGQRHFQYSLDVDQMRPMAVPGRLGSPAVETLDPVDVLNSVAAEGWKLITGKFIHVETRGGLVGCYLFKRSQKRRERMNDPWLSESIPAAAAGPHS